jgi:hypothetical protein
VLHTSPPHRTALTETADGDIGRLPRKTTNSGRALK